MEQLAVETDGIVMGARNHIGKMGAVAGGILCYGFFQWCLPYTFYHREQYNLFIPDEAFTAKYWGESAPLARLFGDYLTLFYYYIGVGPAVAALLIVVLGCLVAQLLRMLRLSRWMAFPVGALVALWETCRQCVLDYPLASTLATVAVATLLYSAAAVVRRKWMALLPLLFSLLFIPTKRLPHVPWWNVPSFRMERLLAIDTEAYFGHWDKVKALTEQPTTNTLVSYYRNLSLAMRGELADSLMYGYQPFEHGLFLPVNEQGDYFQFTAAGEAWFQQGAMTMAEHATILGMIFSPYQHGTRSLRRLAQINLVNGDTIAAEKYLRLLRQNPAHRTWAKQQTEVHPSVQNYRLMLAQRDTIHLATDARRVLRTLLEDNPQNRMARDYLLCYSLLQKDLASFTQDYARYGQGAMSAPYAQALLIASVANPDWVEDITVDIPQHFVNDFNAYNTLMNQTQNNMQALQRSFGKTYWFYYQFAKRNKP